MSFFCDCSECIEKMGSKIKELTERNEKLKAALELTAKQKTRSEYEWEGEIDAEDPAYLEAYDIIIKKAREALAETERE